MGVPSRPPVWILGLLVLSCLLWAAPASGEDVLILTTGRRARGKILEETPEKIRLEVAGGSLWYPRSIITEIRRDQDADEAVASPVLETSRAFAREEFELLYRDGKRVGARVLRVVPRKGKIHLEEELHLHPVDGRPARTVRVVEKMDDALRPLSFQVRETYGKGKHRLVSGDVRDGQLVVSIMEDGRRQILSSPMPEGARFPLGARELFLRESDALGGSLQVLVYDPDVREWVSVTYRDGGVKSVTPSGAFEGEEQIDVRVVVRTRGKIVEREWIDFDLRAVMAEIDGPGLRALSATRAAFDRARADGPDGSAEGTDAAAKVRYADVAAGWEVSKPDPAWLFEKPAVEGGGALLSVRNESLSASVDLFRDPVRRPDVTLEQGAEILQRACRAVAPDFRVTAEGYLGKGEDRHYWLEATATTKGERTRTLARVIVREDTVYRLLAACPATWFDVCRPDFDRILGSFKAADPSD